MARELTATLSFVAPAKTSAAEAPFSSSSGHARSVIESGASPRSSTSAPRPASTPSETPLTGKVREVVERPRAPRGSIIPGASLPLRPSVTRLFSDSTLYLLADERMPFRDNPAHSIASRRGDSVILPAGTEVRYSLDDERLMVCADTFAASDRIVYANGRSHPFSGAVGFIPKGTLLSLVPVAPSASARTA